MREFIIRGAIATLLEVFKTPAVIEPLRPALLKTFKTIWGFFGNDPEFRACVDCAPANSRSSRR